jgi:uncharacterized membrane protein YbaN (DUF454 family)
MVRGLYFACGWLAMALGAVGVFLPVLPTVPFLLLAAFCFARSSPELARRLYDHPRFGPAMRQWRDRRAIGRRAKVSALLAMAAGAAVSWLTIGWPWAGAVTAVLCVTGTWIATRPE